MGKPRPEHVKRKISEGQARRAAETRAQQGPPPDKKKCAGCKQWKPATSEFFTMRKRTYANGEVRVYPSPRCKPCAAKAKRDRIAELPEEERRRKRREASAKRRKNEGARLRRYQRKHSRNKRREAGVPERGPRVKAADREFLPSAPLAGWLVGKRWPAAASENLRRRLRAVRAQESQWVLTTTIDACADVFDEPGLRTELYGDQRPVGLEEINRP